MISLIYNNFSPLLYPKLLFLLTIILFPKNKQKHKNIYLNIYTSLNFILGS